jgi:hypothetical protein
VRVGHGGEHAGRHGLRVGAQVGVHAGDDDVEPAEQLVGLVQAAVDVDVALDAGEDPERRELLVQAGDDVELLLQPLGGQAVGDGEPRRVVGQRHVLVAQRHGGLGHLADRAAAVGPVGVHVQVPAQRGPERGDVVGHRGRLGGGLLERREVVGHLALVCLHDDGRRLRPDALEVLERVRADLEVELLVGEPVDDCGGRAERRHPVTGLAGALQEEGDPPERGRGRERCAQCLTFLACFLAAFIAFFCALAARLDACSKLFSVDSAALCAARLAR